MKTLPESDKGSVNGKSDDCGLVACDTVQFATKTLTFVKKLKSLSLGNMSLISRPF
jgi:hypothetical protein